MRSARGKLIILVVLGLVWIGLLVGRRAGNPPQPAATEPAPRLARTPSGQGQGTPRLKLELLNLPRPSYPKDEQNIFGVPPPPPPPPRPVEAPRPGTGAAAPLDPFQEEVRQLRYIGFLRDGNASTAFLVQGQQVHTAAPGELVAGRFRVVEVGDDFVVLSSPNGDKKARLALAAEAGAAPRPAGPGGPPGGGG